MFKLVKWALEKFTLQPWLEFFVADYCNLSFDSRLLAFNGKKKLSFLIMFLFYLIEFNILNML